MTKFTAAVALASLLLTGCCTRQPLNDFTRFEGSDYRPSGFCGIFSGYGTMDQPDRLSAAYTPVGVSEYGDLLCGHVEPEEYASCVNQIWDHYRETDQKTFENQSSTSGPFAVVVWGEIFLGSYWSDAFSASFQVSNDRMSCRGSYNAFFGATEPVFDVSCDNGKRGKARIVRDREGRNGIGRVVMNDGTVGKIVFGYATVGGALKTSGI